MKKILLKGKYGDGKELLVSDCDYEFVSSLKLWVSDTGYVKTYYKGKHRFVHNLILGAGVDHINQNKLDNRRENLRPATQQQNNSNVKTRASSGYKGVYKERGSRTFRTTISIDGKMTGLGNFPNPRWAALAFTVASKEVRGEFSCCDFTSDEIVAMS